MGYLSNEEMPAIARDISHFSVVKYPCDACIK